MPRLLPALLCLLLAASVAAQPSSSQPAPADKPAKEPAVSPQDVEKKVLAKDPAAVDAAKTVGPSAAPKLIELAASTDPGVRRIALNCLRRTGGDGAPAAFVRALSDTNGQVRGSAIAGLKAYSDKAQFEPARNAMLSMTDPDQQAEVVLIVADLAIAADRAKELVDLFKVRYPLEKEAPVREAYLAALAKLGHEDSRRAFGLSLAASADEHEWLRKLDACDWIAQDWLPKQMLVLLAVKDEVERIGVDAKPDAPHYLRVCDKAAQTIYRLATPKLTFDPKTKINFKDAELSEIREAVRKLP